MTDDLLQVAQGTFLAAAPDMLDPNFMHTVVIMCQHTDDMAYGLVVNRPAKIGINEIMPEHESLAGCDFPVHVGGPVGRDTMQFLHRLPDKIPGGLALADDVYLGGSLDAMARVITEERELAEVNLRIVVGYAGWGHGQLEGELESGAWIPAPMTPELLFERDESPAWRAVVSSLGRATKGMQDMPPDASWN